VSIALSLPMASWPLSRKVVAAGFAAIVLVGLACAAVYLAGALFLVLNKVDPRRAELASIFDYWDEYAGDPQRHKQLVASIAVSGIGLVVVLPCALIATARRRRPLHGDARFATAAEVRRAGLLAEGPKPPPSIIVGRFRGRVLALPGQLSVMLSAPTRSGKGVGVVIPNLLNWPDSVVVLDLKGENFDVTAGYRAKHRQAVYAFSPFDEGACSHRWNPLTAVRTSPLHRVGDLLAIGQVFFPSDTSTTSSEAFFNDQARNLFMGLGLLLLESPDLPRTVGEMLRQSSGKGQPLKAHLQSAIALRAQARKPLSVECVDALQRLLSNSENTLTSIVATFNAPLTIFADAVVDAATSGDDFRLEDVRRRRMSIYVRVPPNRLANARPLLNLFFSQLVSLNTQQLPHHDRTLKWQCLIVNDEFTAMGRVGVISTATAFLAGYNLRLLTVVQAMSQLDAVYGDREARTLATNHGLQILYAPREQRDADEYSAMLGHFTERATTRGQSRSFGGQGHHSTSCTDSDQRRALLLPQEFKELGPERLVVILENCKPILGEKIRYYREKVFAKRVLPPPPVPRMDMDLHFAKAEQRCRYLDDELKDGEEIDVARLAFPVDDLPKLNVASTEEEAHAVANGFMEMTRVRRRGGGAVEPVAEEEPKGESEVADAGVAAAITT
jgi:type IV secretion system protein VirD4